MSLGSPEFKRPLSRDSFQRDRRVKYDPELIRATEEGAPPVMCRSKRSFIDDINGSKAMAAATGSIRELARIFTEIITSDHSSDEILELPEELRLNLEDRASGKAIFITNTPYRPQPADANE